MAPARHLEPQGPHSVAGPSGPGFLLPPTSLRDASHQPQRQLPPSQDRLWAARPPSVSWTCVEIKILRRVRAEPSRRPPRRRRDACSTAWRCRFLAARPSQVGRDAASSPSARVRHTSLINFPHRRVISSIEQKSETAKASLIVAYKKKIETELETICGDILTICLLYTSPSPRDS